MALVVKQEQLQLDSLMFDVGTGVGRLVSRAPLLSRSNTIEMCFFSFLVSSGIVCGGCPEALPETESLATLAREVRSKWIIAESTLSSHPCEKPETMTSRPCNIWAGDIEKIEASDKLARIANRSSTVQHGHMRSWNPSQEQRKRIAMFGAIQRLSSKRAKEINTLPRVITQTPLGVSMKKFQ